MEKIRNTVNTIVERFKQILVRGERRGRKSESILLWSTIVLRFQGSARTFFFVVMLGVVELFQWRHSSVKGRIGGSGRISDSSWVSECE